MGAIVIKSDNAKNLKLLAALAEQLGESVSKLTESQIEDMQLGMLMKKVKTGISISRKTVFEHLDS
jgi:hypothetical protein